MRVLSGLIFLAFVCFTVLVLPILAFLRTHRLRNELDELRAELARRGDDLERVRSTLHKLMAERPGTAASVPTDAGRVTPLAPAASVAGITDAAPRVASYQKPVAAAPPIVAPVPLTTASSADRGPAPAADVSTPEGATRSLGGVSAETVPGPSAPPVQADRVSDTLETTIGGRWQLYAGMAVLLLGLGFFIKYAFDNQWINETTRVVLGGVIGIGMVTGGLAISGRGYRLYGEIVAGGGFVAMYFSTYAAFNFYGLVAQPVAFGLMVIISVGAAFVADRESSQGLAFVAVLGGFATPFLVGRNEDAQVVLLTYDAILVAGTMLLAQRRSWPAVNLASYLLTFLTFAAWASRYYTPDKYVTTEVFLTIFCGMFAYLLWTTRRARTETGDIVSVVLWTAPAAFHVASLNNLLPHSLPLLVYLTIVTLVGVLASVKFDRAWVRLAVFAVTTPVFLEWLTRHTTPGWRVGSLVVMLAMYGMHLIAQGERISRKGSDQWPVGDLVLFHANGLALFGGAYLVVDAFAPQMASSLALGLALWHFGMAWYFGALTGDAGPNSLALGFAFVGFAIGLEFDDWMRIVGWTAESVAVVWVGLRTRRDWMRLGGTLLLAGTTVRLMSVGFFDAAAGFTPVFNARFGVTLVIVAACYALAYLHKREGADLGDRAAPEIGMFIIAANLLTVLLISTEISFYWRMRAAEDANADLARLTSLSVAWAIYGTALIIVGINRRYAPVRYLALALLALTVGKVFLVDLSRLGSIYRIIGFIGLGLALLLGSWLYQKYRGVILGTDR
ncbi:MAG: DUF2339 domain-containing protein [Acidobacteria bacterium]|nr:DUF2339 domain-containing protein [Acidobacteriota bacterium]